MECILWLSERLQWPTWHKGYAALIAVASLAVVFAVILLWFIIALIFRRHFQFSIRSLLVLTVAVAILCSWMAVEMKMAREQKVALNELRKLPGYVFYEWQLDASGKQLPKAQPAQPEWLRKLFGDDFFWSVEMLYFSSSQITDAELARIAGLTQLRHLWLGGTHVVAKGPVINNDIADRGLAHISVINNDITDRGLAHISRLTQLQDLQVDEAQITDKGLAHLARLTQLNYLSLSDNPQITDAGLAHLAGLTQLRALFLYNRQVTDEGVKKLQQALPNCKIYH